MVAPVAGLSKLGEVSFPEGLQEKSAASAGFFPRRMASATFRTKTTPCGVCLWKFACHDRSINSFVLRSRAISYAGARAGPCFLKKGPSVCRRGCHHAPSKVKKIAKEIAEMELDEGDLFQR